MLIAINDVIDLLIKFDKNTKKGESKEYSGVQSYPPNCTIYVY